MLCALPIFLLIISCFFRVLDIIMAKRVADTYLTDRNFDNDDDDDATEEVCIKFMILYVSG